MKKDGEKDGDRGEFIVALYNAITARLEKEIEP